MQRSISRGMLLFPLLIGFPAVAQVAPNQPDRTDSRSVGTPNTQQQANDAMNTPAGRAGRDEPGAHAPTSNEPVLKDGVPNVPGGAKANVPEKTLNNDR
jgi:hypothetical protein